MNDAKILFLKMLRGDILRATYAKMGISFDASSDRKLLIGQTILRSIIEKLSSFRLMNEEERRIVNEILETCKKDASVNNVSNDNEKIIEFSSLAQEANTASGQYAKVKQYASLVPPGYSTEFEYKDAA